jgi:hypothetical protein
MRFHSKKREKREVFNAKFILSEKTEKDDFVRIKDENTDSDSIRSTVTFVY